MTNSYCLLYIMQRLCYEITFSKNSYENVKRVYTLEYF